MSSRLYCLERVAGIEPASSAWKAAALPLCYTRRYFSPFGWTLPFDRRRLAGISLFRPTAPSPNWAKAKGRWWRRLDSNQRRHSSADLQSAAIDRSATPPTVSPAFIRPSSPLSGPSPPAEKREKPHQNKKTFDRGWAC